MPRRAAGKPSAPCRGYSHATGADHTPASAPAAFYASAVAALPAPQPTGAGGLIWLIKRETLRVSKLWTQTVLAPIVSSALFIVVFGFSLGGRIKEVQGFPYKEFIVPGLIVMAMVQ